MPVPDHAKRFHPALRLLGGCPQRLQGICACPEHGLIIINKQNVDRFKLHIFPLPVRFRNIQHNSEGRSLALLTLAVNRTTKQIDHLPGNGQPKPRSLNTVDTAVYLTGEGLVHGCHEFRAHANTRICDNIDQTYAAGHVAFFLTQVYTDTPAWLCILYGIGKNIYIDLVQTELVCIQIFLVHLIDMETEFNILFLDHRL